MPLPTDPADRLQAAWLASGLTQREFAQRILIRELSTLEKWLSRTNPVPPVVQKKVDELLAQARTQRPPDV